MVAKACVCSHVLTTTASKSLARSKSFLKSAHFVFSNQNAAQEPEEDKPWYMKYAEGLTVAAGVLGGIAIGAIGSTVVAKYSEKDKKEEQKQ